ncbi:hypothetical protein LX87_04124 [Larkinella arboricola]|uniref:RNA helicase n=1 Tax=Larkinella arboricola TaxID=643671 RepID=A0A327WQJ7_LARAB|nr:hypothetical protein [Larkinella arboricola]RAJ94239.1 hypothetical protein LX87_04124 [Larkinella arboricola]
MATNDSSETIDSNGKKKCGIIMPISYTEGYQASHWSDVLTIVSEAINEANFEPNLVSNDEAIGLIHERIVNNIYSNEMVVCDVSSKNPNVMFELGLRLAFDKPVIIIKDERTTYSFDTSPIEHLSYPSSLRFGDIMTFKIELTKKIRATYTKSLKKDFSPFLKSFGKMIIPTKIEGKEVPELDFLKNEISYLRADMQRLIKNYLKQSKVFNESDNTEGVYYSIAKLYTTFCFNHQNNAQSYIHFLDFARPQLVTSGFTNEQATNYIMTYWQTMRDLPF